MVTGPNYIFVSTPKCATNTMYSVLPKHFFGKRYGGFHCNRPPRRATWKHTWTIVRNPFDRAVSIWGSTCCNPRYAYWRLAGGKDFGTFAAWLAKHPKMDNPVTRPMHDWLSGIRLDSVIHIEHLEDELKGLPFWREVPLPKLNTHPHSEWPVYYKDAKIIADIRTWAGKDFDMFGYEAEFAV